MAELFDQVHPDGTRTPGIFRAAAPQRIARPDPPAPLPHDCYSDPHCCGDCGTHGGCRCGDESLDPLRLG